MAEIISRSLKEERLIIAVAEQTEVWTPLPVFPGLPQYHVNTHTGPVPHTHHSCPALFHLAIFSPPVSLSFFFLSPLLSSPFV